MALNRRSFNQLLAPAPPPMMTILARANSAPMFHYRSEFGGNGRITVADVKKQ